MSVVDPDQTPRFEVSNKGLHCLLVLLLLKRCFKVSMTTILECLLLLLSLALYFKVSMTTSAAVVTGNLLV